MFFKEFRIGVRFANMSRKKLLTKRQFAVIDDLFCGEYDEQSVLEKHDLSRVIYSRWLDEDIFAEEISRRVAAAQYQSQLLIARYSSMAAARLIQLTNSDKEETARKACLDIISLPQPQAGDNAALSGEDAAEQVPEISDETASKLLTVLAEEEKDNKKNDSA